MNKLILFRKLLNKSNVFVGILCFVPWYDNTGTQENATKQIIIIPAHQHHWITKRQRFRGIMDYRRVWFCYYKVSDAYQTKFAINCYLACIIVQPPILGPAGLEIITTNVRIRIVIPELFCGLFPSNIIGSEYTTSLWYWL